MTVKMLFGLYGSLHLLSSSANIGKGEKNKKNNKQQIDFLNIFCSLILSLIYFAIASGNSELPHFTEDTHFPKFWEGW